MIKATLKLYDWYTQNRRDLPWRKTKSPYLIWVSEIILQQTQVDQGLPYYLRFTSAFPTLKALANASEEEVLMQWQGLGYYSRARNLHHSAKYIYFDLKGRFPDDYKGLLTLKGIGPYTAAAIASIAFNQKVPAIDGNALRVYSRLFAIDSPVDSSKGLKTIFSLAETLMPKKNPGDFNQAVMELGATVCKPKSPDCMQCPVNAYCEAHRFNRPMDFPVKKLKTKVKTVYFDYIVIFESSYTFIEKRTSGIWKGLYQFPLMESADNNVNEMELSQKLEEWGRSDQPLKIQLNSMQHQLSHRLIRANFWQITSDQQIFSPKGYKRIKISELSAYPMPQLLVNYLLLNRKDS